MAALEVTRFLTIPYEEFTFELSRSGGPGGQNVNKVNSKVQLRWSPAISPSLPEPVRERLMAIVANKLTVDGELLVVSSRTRDQAKNREDCLDKLRTIILTAVTPPKARRATRPTRASKERRVAAKQHRSNTKRGRQVPDGD